MMTYELFKDAFVSEFKEHLPKEYEQMEIYTGPIQKMNGQKDCLSMYDKNQKAFVMGPSIVIQDFYEDYKHSNDMNEVLNAAIDIMVHAYENMHENVPELDFSIAKDHIVFQLVNSQMNEVLLKDAPHRDMEDLSIVYRWVVHADSESVAGMWVTNGLAEQLGLSEEDLFALAKENTKRIFVPTVKPLREIMASMMFDEDVPEDMLDMLFDNNPVADMYVISNARGFNGATSMLYDEALQEAAKRLDEDLYILPSSIHEVIVLPASLGDPESFAEMVKDINGGVVAKEEQLSDNVYHYDRKERTITLANQKESLLDKIKDAAKELNPTRDSQNQVQKDLGLAF